MKSFFVTSGFVTVFLILNFVSCAQVTISGPSCVLSGTEYQYNLIGNIPSGAQLCISGGTINGSSWNCTTSLSTGFVRITWNGAGSISFTSSAGNVSQSIAVTSVLQAGSITANKEQFINANASASAIVCSNPAGGGCAASYSFQWQRSRDNLNWENITGAIGQNLNSLSSLTETFFYRRRTTETNSGTVAYSDAAVVYVTTESNQN